MSPYVYLAFGLAMLAAAGACLVLLPKLRRQLRTLRNAGQLSETDAARKLRFFVLLIAVATFSGLIALRRFLAPPPP